MSCSECQNYNHYFCFKRRFDEACDCKCQTDAKTKKKYDKDFEKKLQIKSNRAKVSYYE